MPGRDQSLTSTVASLLSAQLCAAQLPATPPPPTHSVTPRMELSDRHHAPQCRPLQGMHLSKAQSTPSPGKGRGSACGQSMWRNALRALRLAAADQVTAGLAGALSSRSPRPGTSGPSVLRDAVLCSVPLSEVGSGPSAGLGQASSLRVPLLQRQGVCALPPAALPRASTAQSLSEMQRPWALPGLNQTGIWV